MPPWAICAYRDRSADTYTPSGRVPAQIASSWLRFARLTALVVAAYGNSGGVVSGARAHRSAPVEPETAPSQSIAKARLGRTAVSVSPSAMLLRPCPTPRPHLGGQPLFLLCLYPESQKMDFNRYSFWGAKETNHTEEARKRAARRAKRHGEARFGDWAARHGAGRGGCIRPTKYCTAQRRAGAGSAETGSGRETEHSRRATNSYRDAKRARVNVTAERSEGRA